MQIDREYDPISGVIISATQDRILITASWIDGSGFPGMEFEVIGGKLALVREWIN